MATATHATTPAEQGARQTLGWGAGVLVLGLALVGVGGDQVGSAVVLAGLLLTIYAIHTYGRLGPDDGDALERRPSGPDAARQTASRNVWRGGLVALASVVVVAGTSSSAGLSTVVFWGMVIAGGVQVARGVRALATLRQVAQVPQVAQAPTEVAKRRRLEKSAPP